MHLRLTRLLAIAIAGALVAMSAAVATPAFAADTSAPQGSVADILAQLGQLQGMPVEEDVCAKCHPSYDPPASFTTDIKFSHGYHVKMQCADCHTKFPHQTTGLQRPTMKVCMNCHGVYHGPQGIIAKANCDACHKTVKAQCPYSKIPNWAGDGHDAKGKTDTTKECMMCHKQSECDTCHQQKKAASTFTPKDGWAYDPGEADAKSGCYACHGNSTLLAPFNGKDKSFQISDVRNSVHYQITCQQCHPDFRYDATPGVTKVWSVNAGVQCGVCHQTLQDKKLSQPVADYAKSTHAKKINDGDYTSATCASCHYRPHDIQSLDTPEAKATMHADAEGICARCHRDKYNSFNDYYHGQPYKDGAPDAPACWQCHGSHLALAHQDPSSTVNPANLGRTCGQAGCHKGSTEKFADQAAQLIHRKGEIQQQNPLVQLIARVKGVIGLQ